MALYLFRLPMHRVRATPPAVFPELQPTCRLPLVLGRAVVAPLAVGTRQRNDGPHSPGLVLVSWTTGFVELGLSSPIGRYSTISVTAPDPTVRPPSRMANRSPFSMATGVISSTPIATLSPGITISTPSGNVATPVTSVVRR